MDDSTRERLVDGNIWLRGLHMLLFIIAYNIAEAIIVLLAIFQFVCALITGSANEPLLRFGKNLSVYAEDIFEFLTFNSEIRPFPFEPWPNEQAGGEAWMKSSEGKTEEASSEVVIDQEDSGVVDPDADVEEPDTDPDPEKDKDSKS